MKNRLCIFCFYDKDGYVDDYVDFLLKELSLCTERIIIVVNGKLDDKRAYIFKKYSSEIYIRENCGYDAGAYKYIFDNVLCNDELKSYDELILCNDTFFGPLKPLTDIFLEMENKICDFWGFGGFFDVVFPFIQSYFLVFRKSIIQEELLINYFNKYIDEYADLISYVYCQFEVGLFDYLIRTYSKKYDVYALRCKYDIYRNSYYNIKNCNFPIIKKKAFQDYENDKENILYTLHYVMNKTNYDDKLIANCIERIYDLKINDEDIEKIDSYVLPVVIEEPTPITNVLEIEEFIVGQEFYIYGAGVYACKTFWRFARNNDLFKGFVVSDSKREFRFLFGKPIYEFSEIEDIFEKKIILGVNEVHAKEIICKFDNLDNVLRIF